MYRILRANDFTPLTDFGAFDQMSVDLPINLDTVLEQCGGKAEIAGMVLDEFLNQVPTDIGEMEQCLASGDLITAGKAAHRLKGTAGVLGAAKLHPLCASMELAGKEQRADDAAKFLVELKAEAERCVAAVPTVKELLTKR